MRVKIRETSGLVIEGKGEAKKAGDSLTVSKEEYQRLGGEKHFYNLDALKEKKDDKDDKG